MPNIAAATMYHDHRGTIRRRILVSPSHEGVDHRKKIATLPRETVFAPVPGMTYRLFFDQTERLHLGQATCKNILRNANSTFQVLVAARPAHQLPHDHKCPAFADYLQ